MTDTALQALNQKTEHDIQTYIDGVISGTTITGLYERLAVERYQKDLQNTDFLFDKEAAFRVINFVSFCQHVEGRFAGKFFKLEPWQKFIIWNIYGFKLKSNGKRRFRRTYLQVARKNGKSMLCAALALYHLVADNEARGQIYSIASKREQARLVFEMAKDIANQNKKLSSLIITSRDALKYKTSIYKPLASEGKKSDGYSPSFCVADELHQHTDNGSMYNSIFSGMGSREEPLLLAITTAGLDLNCFAYEEYQRATKILKQEITDDSYFIQIFQLDDNDDWRDEKVWRKANPNLGISVQEDFLHQRLLEALDTPSKTVDFRCKNLDEWVNAVQEGWISYSDWSKNIVFDTTDKGIEDICYGGLDLSNINDLTAFSLCFPKDGKYELKTHFFLPVIGIEEKEAQDKLPYRALAEQGYITLTNGEVVDYEEVADYVKSSFEKYDIQYIACDRWRLIELVRIIPELQDFFIEFSQGMRTMSQASQHFERLVRSGNLVVENNPILTNHINCCSVKSDENGNIKIVKPKRNAGKHIDGVIASIMAVQSALDNEKTFKPSQNDIGVFFF